MSASQYERELKAILGGENKILEKITKTCSVIEKDNYFKIKDKPFAVVRAAGSLGVDLVATRGDISFLTEVKTSIGDTLHFSSMAGKPQRLANLKSKQKICKKSVKKQDLCQFMLSELRAFAAIHGVYLLLI
jgi:hypothetical protein